VTLRRSSTTPFAKSSSGSAPPTEAPPQSSTNSERYGKNQLLDIFRAQESLEASNRDVAGLFAPNWNPHSNGTNGRGWGVHDSRDNNGPDVCWDNNGSVHPIGLDEMTESEKEVSRFPGICIVSQIVIFSNLVNSSANGRLQNIR
jgi:PERQ amino acid-rich with GYF domain-containing protein